MNCLDTLSDVTPLVAALAEELAVALTPILMAEQYKAFLERQQHPVSPTLLEMLEIATAQGGLLS